MWYVLQVQQLSQTSHELGDRVSHPYSAKGMGRGGDMCCKNDGGLYGHLSFSLLVTPVAPTLSDPISASLSYLKTCLRDALCVLHELGEGMELLC